MARAISDDDLRTIARIEGRPKMMTRTIAAALGVSVTTAWRLIARFRAEGMIRNVAAIRRDERGGSVECVAYLDVITTRRAEIDAFEAALAVDPLVWSAVRITGPRDYRIQAFVPDLVSARVWYHALLSRPGVVNGELVIARTILERHCFAAAILGQEDRHPRRDGEGEGGRQARTCADHPREREQV
ncbi:hypothetical protein DDF62_22385 [Caulobacter radicis]|uniref:Lrp/AsnC family transcriptional regulator n=1 Tax=Caulobacter radicis TaxID=2172650 RepID=UPI000D579CF2|nr:Lrp/AsnC family transcriptional regulator [Caulobacter radicis]PVM84481.1 hypothetical protein DDF62_22385 [Caulobacter radicis]